MTSIATIAQFYGLPVDTTNSDSMTAAIGQLLREQTFPSLSSNDPLDAPIKQLQQAAVQRIEQLEEEPLNALLATFEPKGGIPRFKTPDEALQALCAQALAKLLPSMGEHESPIMLDNIPEASSFSRIHNKTKATLEEVMDFYKESMPAQHQAPEHQWEKKNLDSLLTKVRKLNSGLGFPSAHSHRISLIGQRYDATPSPLEKLVQAVKASKSTPQ